MKLNEKEKDFSLVRSLTFTVLAGLLYLCANPLANAGVVKMSTKRAINEQITVSLSGNSTTYQVEGATPATIGNGEHTLNLTANQVKISGDITSFSCSGNDLDMLDVSGCPAITELQCYENAIKELSLNKNVNLVDLLCDNNQIETLDLSKNTQLENIICVNNSIKQLDLRNHSKLKALYCFNNQLTSVQLPPENVLEEVLCSSNKLTSLELGNCPKLQLLECYHNNIESLELCNATQLQTLLAGNNRLKQLDITANAHLITLSCANNQLEEIKTTPNCPLLAVTCFNNKMQGTSMGKFMDNLCNIKEATITVDDGGELIAVNMTQEEGNVCYKSDILKLKAKGWKVTDFNGNYMERKEYEGTDTPTASNVIKLKSTANQITLTFDADDINKMNVKGAIKKSQETIEEDVIITYEITPQTEIVIEGDIKLLNCANNSLTNLQVANHSTISWLLCNDNQLTSLNASGCSALEELDTHNNLLTTADVTGCTSLFLFDCSSNQIKGSHMDYLIFSLHNRNTLGERGLFYVLNSVNHNEGNICTTSQVTQATARGWDTYHQYKTDLWELYEGSTVSGMNDLQRNVNATPIAIYNAAGQARTNLQHGVNIVVMSDGSTQKIYKR